MQVCGLMVVTVLVLVAVRLRYCCYVVVWVACFGFGGLVLLFGFVIVFVCWIAYGLNTISFCVLDCGLFGFIVVGYVCCDFGCAF